MHKKLFFLMLTFVSLFANHVNAERYYFQHLGLKNKLSQSSVLCIQQDKSGFMWFGTKDGLNRYDGSNFRTFKYDHKNPQSLGNNAINSLHENKDGNLWIGTDNGIYLYNPIMESFSKLEKKSQDSVCITQPIVQITADSHENIWLIVESQGVFYFDNDKQALFHYPVPMPMLLVPFVSINRTRFGWVIKEKVFIIQMIHSEHYNYSLLKMERTSLLLITFSRFFPSSITHYIQVPPKED